MKNLVNRWYQTVGTAVLTLWCCLAQAEDIEVYRGGASGERPNVMMVIDTSGSMSYWEIQSAADYEPATDYANTYPNDPDGNPIAYVFDSTLYYFSKSYTGDGLTTSDINDLSSRPFPPSALACQSAVSSMTSTGYHSSKFKRWNNSSQIWEPKRWSNTIPPGDTSDSTASIECESNRSNPAGKYTDTKTSNSSKYRNSKRSNYNSSWNKFFSHIYHGNYLNYKIYTTKHTVENKQSRMEITRAAAKDVVASTSDIRLGLARFDTTSDGGFIDIAVDDIENVKSNFNTTIDTYLPWGGTPLSESYYEAALYIRGDSVVYGKDSAARIQKAGTTLDRNSDGYINHGSSNSNDTDHVSTPSVSTSRNGDTYLSPITSACQSISSIVLFTDGVPTNDDGANSKIKTLISGINFPSGEGLSHSCSGNGGCAEELAYYLANFDQRPDLAGKQTIRTHVIGGFFDDDGTNSSALTRMQNIAKHGKGIYKSASNKAAIVAAYTESVAAVIDDPVTFVAPAVAANAYNSLEHLDDLYYAMFVPSADNNWQGNLKSYRLSPEGLVVDAAGDAAIDTSGLFKEASRSYWTDPTISDGGDVVIGGAAANLTKEKNIFTHLTDTKGTLSTTLTTDNITKTMLGLAASASAEEHIGLIDWLNRKDGEGTRAQMEDPLHSRPIVINYSYTTDPTNNRVTANGVVFVGTNSGYLHAFKADKHVFKEYFSFIPKELLANAGLYRTSDLAQPKAYGVDGPINYWHIDVNQNAQVDNGEKVLLFFGLRRGGRHYYALDISDPDAPKFQWEISGGLSDDFDKMGESWAPMTLAKVNWQGKTKVVLLFGGGYDPDEDNRSSRAPNSMGNSVYMIDPESGELLWSASNSGASTNLTEMTSSITSEVKIVDFDGDQITDYFYVSDIGGRIWRFDINKETTGKSDFIGGAGLLFDANKNSSNYQRFYYAPSVSYFSDSTGDGNITLAIGSGYRAHPLQADSKDSFYIIKDPHITSMPTPYKTLQRSDLENIPYGSQLTTAIAAEGWQYDLAAGEKVLATPLTSSGNMFFTTFSPQISAPNPNTCNADIGSSMAYNIDYLGDDDPDLDSVSPVIKGIPLPNIGIAPQVIEVRTSDAGQEAFCEQYPSHSSCQPPPCESNPDVDCPDDCESTGSVILSGTNSLGGGISRCDLVKKDYWRSL